MKVAPSKKHHDESDSDNDHHHRHHRSGKYPAPILKLKNDGTSDDDGLGDLHSKHSSTTGRHSSITKVTGLNSSILFQDNSQSHEGVGVGVGRVSGRRQSNARGRSSVVKKNNFNRRGSEITASDKNSLESSSKYDDNDLPIFAFTAGEEFNNESEKGNKSNQLKGKAGKSAAESNEGNGSSSPTHNNKSGENSGRKRSESPSGKGGIPRVKVKKLSKAEALRTDMNDKAKFLSIPPGKFRREFSLDHPLAPNGKGKYIKELQQGLKPSGIFLNPIKRQTDDIEETLILAEKMEKLTYEAQSSVLDKTATNNGNTDEKSVSQSIDNLKKQLNKKLEVLIEAERLAEEDRLQAMKNITDHQEKYHVEMIFAEERQRASDRIITVIKENEGILKKALLKTMNLGNFLEEQRAHT
jgi:hypothetical protein